MNPEAVAIEIVRTIAHEYGVTAAELRSPSRTARLTRIRHLAMYVVRESTSLSLVEIAAVLGRTDHTTTMHGLRRIETDIETDPNMADLARRYVERFERWPTDEPMPGGLPQPRLPL